LIQEDIMSGRYLVIAECTDSRSGKRFKEGEEFLPAPTAAQITRLEKAGCLSAIPDSAPALPGSDPQTVKIADLETTIADLSETIIGLRATITGNAIKAGSEASALQAKLDAAATAYEQLSEDFGRVRDQLRVAETDRDDLRTARDGLATDKNTLTARVADLEAQVASKEVDGGGDQSQADVAATPAKPARSKAN
jgi:hypothetical protein